MARQGVSRPKVVSSGRLTNLGRGHIYKKKVAGKSQPPPEPAYSLYSTDSEDQVTTIHSGLDRCAALLNGILEAEQAESKAKPQGTKTSTLKSKPKNLSRKTETDKKQHGRKTHTGTLTNKRPAPVQKTILSASSHPGLAGKQCCHSDQKAGIRGAQGSHDQSAGLVSVTKAKHDQQHSVPAVHSQPAANSHVPSRGEVQTSTAFNCRLTTSTPALSPQRPDSAHSEPCSSKSVQSHSSSTQEFANPTQHACSFSMAPAVQKQCQIIVQTPFQHEYGTPVEPEVPLIAGPISDGPQVGSVGSNAPLASSTGNLNRPSAVLAAEMPVHVAQAQPGTGGPPEIHSTVQEQRCCSEESVSATSTEEENEEEPVRDISRQNTKEKVIDLSGTSKVTSPEKTARKVTTVRYLLGELKTLVANQDSEAVRLISEVEQNISLLPVMVGSTNIQAEIALALQPLRSENVQLRRRLRILNQQLQERERAERRARPVDCNMEVVALQSLNLTLQTQLNESRGELEGLQQENMRLQKALENKENVFQQHEEECESENSRLRLELSDALAEVQNSRSKLKECEIERTALTLSLQQREAEISRLQEVVRSLQRNQTKPDITRSSQCLDLPQPNSQLTKSVLELHENEQRDDAADKLCSSVQNYLQTLEGTHTLQPALPCQFDCGRESITQSDNKACSPKVSTRLVHKPTLEAIAENVPQLVEKKITSFVPLRETSIVQLAAGVAHDKPLTQCDGRTVDRRHRQDVGEHVGLKYKTGAFEKLGVSAGLHNQESKCDGQEFLSDHHGVSLHVNQINKSLNDHPLQSQHARRCLKMGVESGYTGRPSLMESTFSSCDIKSLVSDWSINSWSTFNTRDEQNFRDGLAALDASIASLQRTLKADFNK